MARKLTCIVCPLGCELLAEEVPDGSALAVSGNRCPRGAAYAEEEIRSPKRVVTATCRLERSGGASGGFDAPRRLPVKTSVPCPRELIDELILDIYGLSVPVPVKGGARLIENWKKRGIDVIAARSVE